MRELGFDEIQFDYIRYPDSNYKYMVFKDENTYDNRIKNINSFLMVAKKEINSLGMFCVGRCIWIYFNK